MTTLHALARDLGITGHAVYVLAGNLVDRAGYDAVIADRDTADITPAAEHAIREYVAGVVNAVAIRHTTPAEP